MVPRVAYVGKPKIGLGEGGGGGGKVRGVGAWINFLREAPSCARNSFYRNSSPFTAIKQKKNYQDRMTCPLGIGGLHYRHIGGKKQKRIC